MSAAEQRLFGHWDSLKGKIKEHWGQITDDELAEVEGQYDQLVGLIQQKTGEARKQVKRVIEELSEEYGGVFTHAKQAARDYAEHANEAVHDAANRARARAQDSYEQANAVVRRRPAETVAVAFGTGVLVGLVIGLMSRSR